MSRNRRMKNKISRIGVVLMAAVFVVTALLVHPISAEASDEACSLVLQKACPDMKLSIYQIQTEVDDTLVFTEEFKACGINLTELETSEEVLTAASELERMIQKEQIAPMQTGKVASEGLTDGYGSFAFRGLEEGLYLVLGEKFETEDGIICEQLPILLALPTHDEIGAPMAETVVECKVSMKMAPTPPEPTPTPEVTPTPTPEATPTPEETPTPTPEETPAPTPEETPTPTPSEEMTPTPTVTPTPSTSNRTTHPTNTTTRTQTRLLQTGQEWMPVFLLIGGGLIVLVIGLKLKRNEKD